jgi:hypothetical protein
VLFATLAQPSHCAVRPVIAGVELSRCAEPNEDSIEYIILIESAKLKKDVMEHHNDKGISMKHVQIKPHKQFKTALQPRASSKKSKFQ